MNRSDFRGFGKVFKFTFLQMFKSKSFIIGLVIMLLFAVGLFPVYAMINSEDSVKESDIGTIYVINESGLNLDYSDMFEGEEAYKNVKIEETTKSKEDLEKEISKEHTNDLILKIAFDEAMFAYALDFDFDSDSDMDYLTVETAADYIEEWFNNEKMSGVNADAETIAKISREVNVSVRETKDYLEEKNAEIISSDDYFVVYIVIMVMYFLVLFISNVVATKIVEEKANRIVEYLMTNVRPMALITAKVFAATLAVVIELGSVLILGIISKNITTEITGNNFENLVGGMSGDIISMLSIPKLILVIVIIAIGIVLYSFLAGLFGATVTKMEEVQQGMKVYTMILVVSFLMAITASELMWTIGINGFVKFTFYFPFTSAMMLPGAIFIDKVSAATIAIAIGLMLLVTLLLIYFIALVYEALIVNNSGVVSLKQMVSLAVSQKKLSGSKKKGGAKNEEK